MRIEKIFRRKEEDKTDAQIEDSIFLRLIDFGLSLSDGFTHEQIIAGLSLENKLPKWERKIVEKYLEAAYQNAYQQKVSGQTANIDTPFFVAELGNSSHYGESSHKYIISFDAHFKYIDYQELKLAKRTAQEARILSMWAIRISILAIIISALVPLWIAYNMTQTVRIDSNQLQILESDRAMQVERE
ncbi:MAG: hypothetical protein ABH833_04695 [Parcubacteria group bacterium]